MTRMYFDRYTWTLDWSNIHGKTALHIAALRGNEELVRVSYTLLFRSTDLSPFPLDAVRPGSRL